MKTTVEKIIYIVILPNVIFMLGILTMSYNVHLGAQSKDGIYKQGLIQKHILGFKDYKITQIGE